MKCFSCRIKISCLAMLVSFFSVSLQADISTFFEGFKKSPGSVGSIIPTSTRAACAIAEVCAVPFKGERVILEIGAGTGPITEQLVSHLRAGDIFYIVEAEASFAEILRKKLTLWRELHPKAQILLFEGTLEAFERSISSKVLTKGFTHIISTLPFNSLPFSVVEHCISFVERFTRKGGVWSWIEYPFLGMIKETFSFGDSYCRIKSVRGFMKDVSARHGATSTCVYLNVPPVTIYRINFPPAV